VLTPDRRSGLYKLPLPFISGQDVVGTIVQLPTDKVNWQLGALELGQRVWSPVGSSHAEYVAAPYWKVAPLPANVEPKDGVSMCTVALTAATLARESYPVKKGDFVLIRAAAGGVGLVLTQVSLKDGEIGRMDGGRIGDPEGGGNSPQPRITPHPASTSVSTLQSHLSLHALQLSEHANPQLCKHLGATVIATTSTQEKAKIAKDNGADHVLLTTSSDNVKEVGPKHLSALTPDHAHHERQGRRRRV